MDTIKAEWEDTSTSNERKQTDELVGDCACKEEEGTRTMAMRPSRSSLSRGPQSAESRPGRLSLGAESGAGTSTGRGSGFGGGPGGEDSGCCLFGESSNTVVRHAAVALDCLYAAFEEATFLLN